MKPRDVRDLVRFTEDEPTRQTLFETERLWSQVVCIERNQTHGPVSDVSADGLCVILAGEVAVQIGRGRARMKQWDSIVIPAGDDLTVTNASTEPSVLLMVTAPPPS
jgi:glyoxylate utilization-related uncharacterized protein